MHNADPLRLFVLGDSISIQYGPALQRGLGDRVRYSRKEGTSLALENLDVPRGANGGDSGMCRAFLASHFADSTPWPDVLVLNSGLHDIKTNPVSGRRQIELDAYETNLIDISTNVLRHAIKLIWVNTTPVDEAQHNAAEMHFYRFNADVDRYNAVADKVMNAAGVPIIDLHAFSLTQGPPENTLHDGRHFHPPICEAQGTFIAGWLLGWLT